MNIDENIIKYYLKNVMFITGTSYAGKSTIVELLAKRYGMIACGENYHLKIANEIAIPEHQPNLCYFRTMKDWNEYLSRTPEQFDDWIIGCSREAAEFEIAELIRISQKQKVIVDTNIPIDILYKIADYNQIAVMLSPQAMSVEMFFERNDPDKVFIKKQIMKSEDPDKTMANFKACIAKVNSKEHYAEYANSGFFTLVRQDAYEDTREQTLQILANHFKLSEEDRLVE